MELHKDHPLLTFPEVYALKMITKGFTCEISYEATNLYLEPPLGQLFDEIHREHIQTALEAFGVENIYIRGIVSGKKPKFYIYDVKFNNDFLAVPHAANVAVYLKLPFVRYKKMSTKSLRRIKKYSPVELRPLDEFVTETGERMVVRYDRKEKK